MLIKLWIAMKLYCIKWLNSYLAKKIILCTFQFSSKYVASKMKSSSKCTDSLVSMKKLPSTAKWAMQALLKILGQILSYIFTQQLGFWPSIFIISTGWKNSRVMPIQTNPLQKSVHTFWLKKDLGQQSLGGYYNLQFVLVHV